MTGNRDCAQDTKEPCEYEARLLGGQDRGLGEILGDPCIEKPRAPGLGSCDNGTGALMAGLRLWTSSGESCGLNARGGWEGPCGNC